MKKEQVLSLLKEAFMHFGLTTPLSPYIIECMNFVRRLQLESIRVWHLHLAAKKGTISERHLRILRQIVLQPNLHPKPTL